MGSLVVSDAKTFSSNTHLLYQYGRVGIEKVGDQGLTDSTLQKTDKVSAISMIESLDETNEYSFATTIQDFVKQ